MSDEKFVNMVKRAMSELSPDHMSELRDVSILVADEPTEEQREELQMRGDDLLLGLYQGVPRTMRGGNESGLLSDTITIFKKPLMTITSNEEELYEQIKRTVWHEVAHYYGLDHDHMDALQRRRA